MRVPYLWLKDYFNNLTATPEEIAEKLTLSGIEVDAIEDFNPGVSGIVAGVIEQSKPHPRKDNISVLTVNAGEEKSRQIICGAKNAETGQRVIVALPGSILPGGREIKEIEYHGVLSEGMLCSAGEMGLELVQEEEGILIMDSYVPTGTDMIDYLGLNDRIIVLSLTPNRADCLGLIGVAHEIAALINDRVKMPPEEPEESGEHVNTAARVEIKDNELCRRYTARVIKGIKTGISPLWLQVRLLKAGIRPISNIVDITNYVMWEYGQPLHAFDYSLVAGGEIIVRRAGREERIVTIDGRERILNENNLVIADSSGPVALAGVMGGENTEINPETKDVLLESAVFDPVITRRTARGQGLVSEASHRFEKGVNPEWVMTAQNRAARLIAEMAEGKVMKGAIDDYPRPFEIKEIEVSPDRVDNILGVKIPVESMANILERLGFTVEMPDIQKRWTVKAPLRRPDVTLEEDIVEEIARVYGYENIPVILPEGTLIPARQSGEKRIQTIVRDAMLACGFNEIITYSFINSASFDKLNLPGDDMRRNCIQLKNPISEEQGVMRTTLLPGMLGVVKYNYDYKITSQLLFEIGSIFIPGSNFPDELPLEKPVLGLTATGMVTQKNWNLSPGEADFFYLKGVIEAALESVCGESLSFEKIQQPFLHPGQAAHIKINDVPVGFMGMLHPDTCREFGLKQEVAVAEIELASVMEKANLFKNFKALPRYPASLRDLAVVVPENVSAAQVELCIRQTGGELVESVILFDTYEGSPIPAGHRSLAYSIVYRSGERTLTDEMVAEIHGLIEQKLDEELGVSLRK